MYREAVNPQRPLTPEVVFLHYRAPELLFAPRNEHSYSFAIDVWSVGCIFLEIVLGSSFFSDVMNEADHILRIITLLGTPAKGVWDRVMQRREGIPWESLPVHNPASWDALTPTLCPDGRDLLRVRFPPHVLYNPALRGCLHSIPRYASQPRPPSTMTTSATCTPISSVAVFFFFPETHILQNTRFPTLSPPGSHPTPVLHISGLRC